MKSIFRATAILSGSSIVSILVGLVSAKVMALVLQPAGYGHFGLLQNFVGLTTLMVGMGMATGLVRTGAAAVTRGDHATIASLRKAAWLLFGGLGGLAFLLVAAFRATISQWVLGTPDQGASILLMGIAVLFTVAGNIQMGTLNAHHCVKALAKLGIANALLGAVVSIPAILIWHRKGIVPAIIGGALVSWAVSTYLIGREVGPVRVQSTRRDTLKAAWSLLRFGGPFTASTLMGAGVQLSLPMVVLHLLSAESVGFYRAATAISVNYLGFLVTAMGLDYYPRVSAVKDQPRELVKLINQQHRLVMLLAVPMILGTIALVPYLVPIVYSHKFTPTVDILEWQLIGDLLKFSSWTMAYALLARCGSSVYFLAESIGGVAILVTTWLGVRWFGLSGLGISFVATYIIYYFAVWVIIRRHIPITFTAWNKRMMLAGVAAALVVRILPSTRFASFRTPVGLALAMAFGIPSLITIWREFRRPDETTPGAALSRESEQTAVIG